MKLSNWHWAVLVFFANLVVMWLFGPSRPTTVRAADPPHHHPRPVLTLGGLTNYIPFWTRDDRLGNSVIYQNGSDVGIGTTSPGATLEVNGSAKFDGNLNFAGGLTGIVPIANGGTGISSAPTEAGQYLRSDGAGSWSINTIQAGDAPSSNGLLSATIPLLLVAVPCPPSNCGTGTAKLTFFPISTPTGWTVSGDQETLTAGGTGIGIGALTVIANTQSAVVQTVLTVQVYDNGVPVPGAMLSFATANLVNQTASVSFILPVTSGDAFTVLAACGPSTAGPLCVIDPTVQQSTLTMALLK
ncbi:MAG TPA: hypothetical protein VJX73_03905 [Terracidiphilus sp.]|nr:hypothetical protein [Terracidiphilus sp.]